MRTKSKKRYALGSNLANTANEIKNDKQKFDWTFLTNLGNGLFNKNQNSQQSLDPPATEKKDYTIAIVSVVIVVVAVGVFAYFKLKK